MTADGRCRFGWRPARRWPWSATLPPPTASIVLRRLIQTRRSRRLPTELTAVSCGVRWAGRD